MNKLISISFLMLLFTVSCKTNTEVKIERSTDSRLKEIEDLELKLEATEAQLLNIRTELAKCTGDTIAKY